MGKGIKRPGKAEKPDFKKKKLKVGRKLTKQANETKIDVRVAKLSLPSLPLDDGSAGAETPGQGKLNVHEALRKLSHHNAKVKIAALHNLTSILQQTSSSAASHLAAVLEGSIPCLHDEDREVRTAFLTFWQDCIQKTVSQEKMCPFVPLVMANIRSACSHLNISLRHDALKFLRMLIAHSPQAVVQGHASSLMQLFVDILSQKHRERSLAAHAFSVIAVSVNTLEEALVQFCDIDQGNPASAQTRKSESINPKKNVRPLDPAWTYARPYLQIPGVFSFALNGEDGGMALAQHVNGARNTEVGPSIQQALCARLRSCWDDCGPLQSVTSLNEAKLSCMASILNCIRQLYSFTGTGSGPTEEIAQDTDAFIHAKVLACFPVAVQHVSEAMHSEAAHKLNTSASRLLMTLSDAMFTSARLKYGFRKDSISAIPACKDTIGAQLLPGTATCNLHQACVSSSQAFASWTSTHHGRNEASFDVYGGAVAAVARAETTFAEPNRVVDSITTYCKSIIKLSMETGLEARGSLGVSSMQLSDVLKAAGGQLVCLKSVGGEHHQALLQDVTELLASPMSSAKLDICARFAMHMCITVVEKRCATPVAQHVLHAWVESLAHAFLESSMMDSGTLEVILRCRLCLCCMARPGKDFAEELMIHAIKLALVNPDASVTPSLQGIVTETLSYSRPTSKVCFLLCQALENGNICLRDQLLVADTLLGVL